MAMNRLLLHELLTGVLGSKNVYYQPPESIKLKYPCLIYELAGVKDDYADNERYRNYNRYTVTLIDPNPDTEIREKLLSLRYCSFDRHFATDGLNHEVFTIFF